MICGGSVTIKTKKQISIWDTDPFGRGVSG